MALCRAAFFLAVLGAASAQTLGKCKSLDKKERFPPRGGKEMKGEKAVMAMASVVVMAIGEEIMDNDKIKDTITSHGRCQWECFAKIMSYEVLPTFWATGMIKEDNWKTLASESVTGAIKACYPGVPRAHALDFSRAVMKTVDGLIDGTEPLEASNLRAPFDFDDLKECHSSENEEAAMKFKHFVNNLMVTIGKVTKKDKYAKLNSALEKSYQCQGTCLFGPLYDMSDKAADILRDIEVDVGALRRTLDTLWDSGNVAKHNYKEVGVDAITGAMHTCYPHVAHSATKEFVSEVVDLLMSEVRSLNRLYNLHMPAFEDEETGMPLTNIVAFGVAIMGTGMTVGALSFRRVASWGQRDVEMPAAVDESGLE